MSTDIQTKNFVKVKIPEYSLRYVKEEIGTYRREQEWLGDMNVEVPVEAETSLAYLQEHYSSVTFKLSNDLRYGELLLSKKVDTQEPDA